MKIFFMQSRKFVSLIASDGPIAAPSAEKFRRARPILFLLGLLLGLSGCVGTQFEPSPTRFPRQVEAGSPVSVAVANQFPAHVTAGGSVRVFEVDTWGGYAHQINDKWQIGLAGNYEFADFDFSGMHNFYNPRPWSELHIFGGTIPIMYTLSDKWTLALLPVAQMAGEPGANWSRAVSYGGVVGAIYHFGRDRMIGLGVGGIDNLAQVSVFPFFVVNWKFNEHLRLNTPYRAGPSGPGGIELTYIVTKDLEFALGVSYQAKRFRLSQHNINADGIGEYDNIPVFARLSYRIVNPLEVNLYGGASVFNQISIDDSKGDQLFKTHSKVAPFIGAGLSLKFDPPGG
jgi:Domain of unknown function (DUF6268)